MLAYSLVQQQIPFQLDFVFLHFAKCFDIFIFFWQLMGELAKVLLMQLPILEYRIRNITSAAELAIADFMTIEII